MQNSTICTVAIAAATPVVACGQSCAPIRLLLLDLLVLSLPLCFGDGIEDNPGTVVVSVELPSGVGSARHTPPYGAPFLSITLESGFHNHTTTHTHVHTNTNTRLIKEVLCVVAVKSVKITAKTSPSLDILPPLCSTFLR